MKQEARTFGSRAEVKKQALTLFDALNRAKANAFSPSQMDWTIGSKLSPIEVTRMLATFGYKKAVLPHDWVIDPQLKEADFLAIDGKKYPVLVREPLRGFGSQIVMLGIVLPTLEKALTALDPIIAPGKQVLTIRSPSAGVVGLAVVAPRIPQLKASMRVTAADVVSLDKILDSLGFTPHDDGSWISRKHGVIVEFPTETTVAVMDAPF